MPALTRSTTPEFPVTFIMPLRTASGWLIRSCFVVICALCFSTSSRAELVSVEGTNVTFEAPDGFTPLSKAELDAKFPSKNGPSHAVGNERRGTTVSYALRDSAATVEMLERERNRIGDVLGRAVPGIQWIDRKMVELDGRRWAYYELTSTAIDADIHNIIVMTAYRGRLLVFNFNATKKDFEALQAELRASIESIRLNE